MDKELASIRCKESSFDIKTYIPLLAVGITVIGTVIGSAFTIIGKNQSIETDIRWIKDELKEIKSQTKNINESVVKTDNVIEGFSEFIVMLENKMNEPPPEVRKKGKR